MKKKDSETIDCVKITKWAASYVEGELPATIKQTILLHIQTCRSCAQLVHDLQRTVAYCRLEPGCCVPPDVHEKLWATLNKHLKRKK